MDPRNPGSGFAAPLRAARPRSAGASSPGGRPVRRVRDHKTAAMAMFGAVVETKASPEQKGASDKLSLPVGLCLLPSLLFSLFSVLSVFPPYFFVPGPIFLRLAAMSGFVPQDKS